MRKPYRQENPLRSPAFDFERERGLEACRTEGAAELLLVLARVFGNAHNLTGPPVFPFLTTGGTIGLVNACEGTAWDTDVMASDNVQHLGFANVRHGSAPRGWRCIELSDVARIPRDAFRESGADRRVSP